MKRDKVVSIKVNSRLLDAFKSVVDEHTSKYYYNNRNYYNCMFSDKLCSGKFTIADLLEQSLKEFIDKNTNKKINSE